MYWDQSPVCTVTNKDLLYDGESGRIRVDWTVVFNCFSGLPAAIVYWVLGTRMPPSKVVVGVVVVGRGGFSMGGGYAPCKFLTSRFLQLHFSVCLDNKFEDHFHAYNKVV